MLIKKEMVRKEDVDKKENFESEEEVDYFEDIDEQLHTVQRSLIKTKNIYLRYRT